MHLFNFLLVSCLTAPLVAGIPPCDCEDIDRCLKVDHIPHEYCEKLLCAGGQPIPKCSGSVPIPIPPCDCKDMDYCINFQHFPQESCEQLLCAGGQTVPKCPVKREEQNVGCVEECHRHGHNCETCAISCNIDPCICFDNCTPPPNSTTSATSTTKFILGTHSLTTKYTSFTHGPVTSKSHNVSHSHSHSHSFSFSFSHTSSHSHSHTSSHPHPTQFALAPSAEV